MIFEIEEYPAAGGDQVAHHPGTFGGVELHPHLVGQGGLAQGRHDLLGGGRGGYIQSDDQMLSRIVHPGEV